MSYIVRINGKIKSSGGGSSAPDDNFHLLPAVTTTDSTDEYLLWDSSLGAYRKITFSDLVSGIGGGFLKLDCSNDPLTGNLRINSGLDRKGLDVLHNLDNSNNGEVNFIKTRLGAKPNSGDVLGGVGGRMVDHLGADMPMASMFFRVTDNTTGAEKAQIGFVTREGAVRTTRMLIESNGFVGIGKVPTVMLDVNGTIRNNTNSGTTPFIVTRSSGNDQSLQVWIDDNAAWFSSVQDENEAGTYGSYIFRAGNQPLQNPNFIISDFRSSVDVERFHLDVDTGRLGLSKTIPTEILDVFGNINVGETANGSGMYKIRGETILKTLNGTSPEATHTLLVGLDAGLNLVNNSYDNTLVGYSAGKSLTIGYQNTALGYEALTTNTTGYNNVAIGVASLKFATTAYNNTAVGFRALVNATDTNLSTALGFQALVGVTTGISNTGLGANTMASGVCTGSYNTAIGSYALTAITTGTLNVGVGNNALASLTIGGYNTAIGAETLRNVTTGSYHVAIGRQALFSMVSNSYAIAIGHTAGYSNTGGANVFIGADSGKNNVVGINNVMIGTSSGNSNLGSGNIFLGHRAGYLNTASNSIFIGFQAGYNEIGSNKLYIENSSSASPLIYGEFDTNMVRVNGRQEIVGSPDYDGLRIYNSSNNVADSSLVFYKSRNGGAVVNEDYTGGIYTYFKNSAVTDISGAGIYFKVLEVTAGSENASLSFVTRLGAVRQENMFLNGTGNLGINTRGANARIDTLVTNGQNTRAAYFRQSDTTNNPRAVDIVNYGTGTSLAIEHNNSNVAAYIDVNANSSSSARALMLDVVNTGGGRADALIVIAGRVGFGTTTPSEQLEMTGNIKVVETVQASIGIIFKGTGRFLHDFNYGNNGTVTVDGRNLFLGYNAGNLTMGSTATVNTNSSDNIGIGYNTGINITTGYANVFVGNYAGFNNNTGYLNTFVGHQAGYNDGAGRSNTFIGQRAGYSTTSGNENTFVGRGAGQANTTAQMNTFIGESAGSATNTGGSNTFVGQRSGSSNLTGYDNTYVGMFAGYYGTTSYSNTLIGQGSGYNITTGSQNAFLGKNAGYGNTSGSGNLMAGYEAGCYIADGSNPNTTTTNSIYLGAFTKSSAIAMNNEIAIGYQVIGKGSNTVTIGNSNITDNYFTGDIETTSTGAFYMGDQNTDGSWRIVRSGNDLVMERRESGVWVTKQTITA